MLLNNHVKQSPIIGLAGLGGGIASYVFLSAGGGTYEIARSLRFDSGSSAYLNKTPTAGNRKTWTWSAWIKRNVLSASKALFESRTGTSDTTIMQLSFNASDQLQVVNYSYFPLISSSVYRDTSSWYHIVWHLDTTQSTASDKMKLYVNGVEVTAFGTDNRSTLGTSDQAINQAAAHYLGAEGGTTNYFDGYMADVWFIDGQALEPTSFGEFDADTGVWNPKRYTGAKSGNSFHLPFSNNTSTTTLGYDDSGNSNNWTTNGFDVGSIFDSATGAFPILNTDATGATATGGTRTDSGSSSIALALPLVDDGSDKSADIKGSGSNKTVTNTNVDFNSTQYKFYGGSAYVNSASTDKLAITNFSSGDFHFTGDFTVECFIYPTASSPGDGSLLFIAQNSPTSYFAFNIDPGNTFNIYLNSTSPSWQPSASSVSSGQWHHLALVRSGSTITLYVNGSSIGTTTNSSSLSFADPDEVKVLGGGAAGGINSYLQDLRIYTGLAKYTSSFTPPITNTSIVASGNDSLLDSPTAGATANDTGLGGEISGEYATWNPLNSSAQIFEGNLEARVGTTAPRSAVAGFAVNSGKWYAEITRYSNNLTRGIIGIIGAEYPGKGTTYPHYYTDGVFYIGIDGTKTVDGSSSSYGDIYDDAGDIIGVALDFDSNEVTFYKNGVSQGAISKTLNGYYTLAASYQEGAAIGVTVYQLNSGQRPFRYPAPSGFKTWCKSNLPTPTIGAGSTAMDVVLWTGDGNTSKTILTSFDPHFVWAKSRTYASNHQLADIVRGGDKVLFSNTTDSEDSSSNFGGGGLYSLGTNQFTIQAGTSSNNNLNTSSSTNVGWYWSGGTAFSNSAGTNGATIASSGYANASAGFSIVTYTGTGSAATVGHGLTVDPGLLIIKRRDSANQWTVYSKYLWESIANNFRLLQLNQNYDANTNISLLNSTQPTSTVFSIGTDSAVNGSSGTYVAYCFAAVDGYSAFGSYTGNGSSDGPFAYTGFRPRWVMIKRTDSAANWRILDTARDTYNVASAELYPNLTNVEGSYDALDITSNGFKLRNTDASYNASGGTYIFASFAEHPFKYARAR